jgi:hypothetical protein
VLLSVLKVLDRGGRVSAKYRGYGEGFAKYVVWNVRHVFVICVCDGGSVSV